MALPNDIPETGLGLIARKVYVLGVAVGWHIDFANWDTRTVIRVGGQDPTDGSFRVFINEAMTPAHFHNGLR